MRLSSNLLFNKKETEIPDIKENEAKRIVKFGLIIHFRNKIPLFLHQSYAKYFLATNELEKLKQEKHDEEIDQILKKKEFFLVRTF